MIDADAWGVVPGFHDTSGRWCQAPPATIEAILASMGARDGVAHPDEEPGVVQTVRLDHPLPPVAPGRLVLEGGGELRVGGALPPDLPAGYHRMHPDDGPARLLVVSPGRCPTPTARRWGFAAQLYATRSSESWGVGDLGDLARLTAWGRRLGADATLLSPLHAGPPGDHPQPSPYFPSSRCFYDPLYLRIESIPGAGRLERIGELSAAGHELNSNRRIERDQVWALKAEALETLFAQPGAEDGLDEYLAGGGDALERFAVFNALAERHGLPWQRWPVELRRPDHPEVAAFAAGEGRRRVRFHAWLQRLADHQLAAADPGALIADLAVGVDAGGADAWIWQDAFAGDVRVGAPPDGFNRSGQEWGLAPFDPWRLRALDYEPFVRMVRTALRHAGGLRVDHVMGLFRLYWIPEGVSAEAGAYVRYPYWDLLNILSLEADRAGAFVVGEDLGTVEDRVRTELAERQVLSYRLLWFEPTPPAQWPPDALGAITTHDLPTVAGVWSGEDVAAQRRIGIDPDPAAADAMRRRLLEWAGATEGMEVGEVVERAYRALSDAPCQLLTVSLDDLALSCERPNMPGTVGEWPNWCLALPVTLEQLERSALAEAVAAALRAATDAGSGQPDGSGGEGSPEPGGSGEREEPGR